ncbi:MAG: NAD(P)/FAD-dependent oxidoreductase, partial [Proteobacteria bacterium]
SWSERCASQPELLRYLNFVTDRLELRPLIQFETWLTAATWHPERALWEVTTSGGSQFRTRFLVMATGNLSAARVPAFPGLDDYKGEWVRTSHWPDREVKLAGRKVAVIGTGSSGVQSIPVIARSAEHLTVFQRSPNYSVPACNGPADQTRLADIRARVPEVRKELFATVGASNVMLPSAPMADYDEEGIAARLEKQWNSGGHGMSYLFADQGRNEETNHRVAEFVRDKIRSIVRDPEVAEILCPHDHGIGTRRLCVDTDYYATYNRDNVTLVNVRDNPIVRITETGIQTSDGQAYDVDLIVFALGFHPFTGAWDRIDIRNEKGERPTDHWGEGPKTLLGLMTRGFPNFFFLTGPGSPSVLANLFLMNEYHADWVGEL